MWTAQSSRQERERGSKHCKHPFVGSCEYETSDIPASGDERTKRVSPSTCRVQPHRRHSTSPPGALDSKNRRRKPGPSGPRRPSPTPQIPPVPSQLPLPTSAHPHAFVPTLGPVSLLRRNDRRAPDMAARPTTWLCVGGPRLTRLFLLIAFSLYSLFFSHARSLLSPLFFRPL